MTKLFALISYATVILALTSCASETTFFSKNKTTVPATAKKLAITIQNGSFTKAKNPAIAYQPVNFTIVNGNCNSVAVNTIPEAKSAAIKVCYKANVLFLDEKHLGHLQDSQSTRFYYSPLWQQGFTYQNITTSGNNHFSNANITIKVTQ